MQALAQMGGLVKHSYFHRNLGRKIHHQCSVAVSFDAKKVEKSVGMITYITPAPSATKILIFFFGFIFSFQMEGIGSTRIQTSEMTLNNAMIFIETLRS